MRNKSVLQEAQDIQRAVDLIRLGARMQMLEVETSVDRRAGRAPAKVRYSSKAISALPGET